MRKQNLSKINLKEIVKLFLYQKGDMSIESVNEYFKEVYFLLTHSDLISIKLYYLQHIKCYLHDILYCYYQTISKSRGNDKFGFSFVDYIDELYFQQESQRTELSQNVDLI